MKRQSIIIVQTPDSIQAWGNFKRACNENALPYHSLKAKKFPIKHKDYVITKVPFNGSSGA